MANSIDDRAAPAPPQLPDGSYLTVPIHGHPHATRRFDVVPGVVMIKRWPFTQEDFFRVNRLA